jgi:acetylglutamate kinase
LTNKANRLILFNDGDKYADRDNENKRASRNNQERHRELCEDEVLYGIDIDKREAGSLLKKIRL